jgi:hypothetical protein
MQNGLNLPQIVKVPILISKIDYPWIPDLNKVKEALNYARLFFNQSKTID